MDNPQTLDITDELRERFENLLAKTRDAEPVATELALGEILSMDKDGMRVDIGGKSEAVCPMREIPGCMNLEELEQQYKVGQAIEFYVMSEQDRDDDSPYYRVSLRRVNAFKNWDQVDQLQSDDSIIEVTVTGATKGGVLVQVMDLKGFVPASQIRVAKTLPELVGETLQVKILEVDKTKNKLILSNRAAVFETYAAQRLQTLQALEEGDIVEGAIVKMTHFGVFIDINGIDGLLPLSEISWRRVQHPSDALQLGDKVRVQVLNIDLDRQRISLSKKRLEADPWDTLTDHVSVGDEVTAPITKQLNSGVLAEILPGVEAYCHVSSRPDPFEMGERYIFKIVSIYQDDRRITLKWVSDDVEPLAEEAPQQAEEAAVEETVAAE
jgi:ribosomal protein S1